MIAAILSGDDFGLAPAINQGILAAYERGCLTSASLSVAGPAAEAAAQASRAFPELGIGLHLTLSGERPLSPPEAVPSLVDADGRLPAGAFAFAGAWLARRIRPEEVRREVRAQLERARELDVRLTHLDGHDHLHILPGVFEIVVEEMKRASLARVRIPLESAALVRGDWMRRAQRTVLNACARRAARIARRAGLVFPERFLGFLGAGHVDVAGLVDRFEALEDGVTELVFHPAAGDGIPRADLADWGYDWASELEALTSARAQEALERRGVQRISYAALPPSAESGPASRSRK